jgi:propanol-preferring alcohol dehydrogenase
MKTARLMRAMVLHEFGGSFSLEKVPIPKVGSHDVLIRNQACGCGLTLSHVKNEGRPGANLPLIMGHEIGGEIIEIGEEVKTFDVGDHATLYFYLSCGFCRYCRSGLDPLCENLEGFIGTHTGTEGGGGFAEYIRVPAQNVFKLPKKVPLQEACIVADAIATPLHVVRERANVRPLDNVVIVGAGGVVGIHTVQMAKLFGGRVIGIDINEEKLEKVKEVGGDEVINVHGSPDFDKEVKKITSGKGADAVIDFVCNEQTLQAGFRSLGVSGKQIILAKHPNVMMRGPPAPFTAKEIIVTGSRFASKSELSEAIEMMSRDLIIPIVTRTFPLEETNEVFDLLKQSKIIGRAVIQI